MLSFPCIIFNGNDSIMLLLNAHSDVGSLAEVLVYVDVNVVYMGLPSNIYDYLVLLSAICVY